MGLDGSRGAKLFVDALGHAGKDAGHGVSPGSGVSLYKLRHLQRLRKRQFNKISHEGTEPEFLNILK